MVQTFLWEIIKENERISNKSFLTRVGSQLEMHWCHIKIFWDILVVRAQISQDCGGMLEGMLFENGV